MEDKRGEAATRIIILPDSELIGKTPQEILQEFNLVVEPVSELLEPDIPFAAGNQFRVRGKWKDIQAFVTKYMLSELFNPAESSET